MNKTVVAFGEIMMRLAAKDGFGIADSPSFDVCYGGTEANVLACLASFGYRVKYLSALPDNELGKAVLRHLNGFGIDTSSVAVGGDILGAYFVENGTGSRGSNVVYNRRFSEFTRLNEQAFNFDEVFADAALFHISGISFALSESSRALAFRLVDEAKKRGVKVSFDFNYRSKLWSTEAAGEVFRAVVPKVDIVLASDLDLSTFLRVTEEEYFRKYENEILVLRNRRVLSGDRHSVAVTLYRKGAGIEKFELPRFEFAVEEKIGGGDAFDGGILHGLLKGDDIETAVRFAVAAFALKHKIKGDTFTGTEEDVVKYGKELGILS